MYTYEDMTAVKAWETRDDMRALEGKAIIGILKSNVTFKDGVFEKGDKVIFCIDYFHESSANIYIALFNKFEESYRDVILADLVTDNDISMIGEEIEIEAWRIRDIIEIDTELTSILDNTKLALDKIDSEISNEEYRIKKELSHDKLYLDCDDTSGYSCFHVLIWCVLAIVSMVLIVPGIMRGSFIKTSIGIALLLGLIMSITAVMRHSAKMYNKNSEEMNVLKNKRQEVLERFLRQLTNREPACSKSDDTSDINIGSNRFGEELSAS